MTAAEIQSAINKTWTVQRVCVEYEVSHMTVHAWRKAGLEAIVINGNSRPAIRFLPDDVKQFVKARKVVK